MKLPAHLSLKWLLVLVLGAAGGMGVMRLMSESKDDARMARVARRGFNAVPPGFFDVAPLATKDESGPAVIKPGQVLAVEVLEALPGRPITGERTVLPDGTISLGFYGDVQVAGLNRNQTKVKILEHLRKYLNDRVLGLAVEQEDGKIKTLPPVESDRLFVAEVVDDPPRVKSSTSDDLKALSGRIDGLNDKLDRILKELERSRPGQHPAEPTAPDPARPAVPASGGSTPG